MASTARIRLLGAEMDITTAAEVFDFAAARLAEGRSGLVANHNLHSLHLLRRDPGLAPFFASADLIEIDSTPIIAWGRLMGRPLTPANRCTYLDWREAFWARASREGWKVFHLGCAPGVTEAAADSIHRRWPQARIAGRHGFFDMDGADNAEVLAQIAAFDPDILFVGMGMPRQERWILANRARLGRSIIFSIGAAFDYEAGMVPTPPRWAGRLGLEWLFRFVVEPQRLFQRYFIEPWSLIPSAVDDALSRIGARGAGAAAAAGR